MGGSAGRKIYYIIGAGLISSLRINYTVTSKEAKDAVSYHRLFGSVGYFDAAGKRNQRGRAEISS